MNTPPNPNEPTLRLSWDDCWKASANTAEKVMQGNPGLRLCSRMYGVPRGGCCPVLMISVIIGSRFSWDIEDSPENATCFIDDVWDTGKTEAHYRFFYPNIPFFTLFDKRTPPYKGKWLVFPWEKGRED